MTKQCKPPMGKPPMETRKEVDVRGYVKQKGKNETENLFKLIETNAIKTNAPATGSDLFEWAHTHPRSEYFVHIGFCYCFGHVDYTPFKLNFSFYGHGTSTSIPGNQTAPAMVTCHEAVATLSVAQAFTFSTGNWQTITNTGLMIPAKSMDVATRISAYGLSAVARGQDVGSQSNVEAFYNVFGQNYNTMMDATVYRTWRLGLSISFFGPILGAKTSPEGHRLHNWCCFQKIKINLAGLIGELPEVDEGKKRFSRVSSYGAMLLDSSSAMNTKQFSCIPS
ncbi:hypothetical protein BC830DRAFT_1086018 [Chytriomyces sp. MP71]|nr:hypothetical protein BC830DRAFT_1086018 [Chytriomyces sp. MP71]